MNYHPALCDIARDQTFLSNISGNLKQISKIFECVHLGPEIDCRKKPRVENLLILSPYFTPIFTILHVFLSTFSFSIIVNFLFAKLGHL
jgi:hypothetical protein